MDVQARAPAPGCLLPKIVLLGETNIYDSMRLFHLIVENTG